MYIILIKENKKKCQMTQKVYSQVNKKVLLNFIIIMHAQYKYCLFTNINKIEKEKTKN